MGQCRGRRLPLAQRGGEGAVPLVMPLHWATGPCGGCGVLDNLYLEVDDNRILVKCPNTKPSYGQERSDPRQVDSDPTTVSLRRYRLTPLHR